MRNQLGRGLFAMPSLVSVFLVLAAPGCGGSGDGAPVGSLAQAVRNDPNHVFLPAPPFNFAACGTIVHVEFPVNNEYAKVSTLPDGTVVQMINGSFKALLTDTQTGKQIDVNASGPGTLTIYPDGRVLFEGRGPALIFFNAAAAAANGLPQLFLSHGQTDILFAPGAVAQVQNQTGSVRDLCAELN